MAGFSKPRGVLPMLFALILFLQVTIAVQHGHHQHMHRNPEAVDVAAMEAHIEETRSLLQERANNVAIVGVTGTVAPRLEIRDLKKNADQWNLYLLGMERFKAKAKTDRLSYYQVVGVHGRPYVTWNNFPTPLLNVAGFCPHAQTLFGSWHRPYLALYEQAWYQSVQEVIATFPSSQQQRWKNAASTLRMPYYDWAKFPGSGQPAVPTMIRDATVTVTKPSGQVTIPNPIYSYTWGSSLPSEMGGGPWSNFATTLRRPLSNPTRSNNNEMNARFGSIRISLRDRLYGLFMSGASWGSVTTSQIGVRTRQNGNNPDSFESVHDAVHVTAGGETGGHMYYLDYSSFDPFFWLHHTNIDRLMAMYQVISPNTWVANGNVNRPMAQWKQGEAKNSFSPLKPFTKNTAGTYYTSEDVKNTRIFGYVYPETNGSPSASSVRSAVNNLYGPNAATKKRSTDGQYEGRPFQDGDYQTVLSVQANKYMMDGSYTVHCFIGDSSSNSTNATAPYPSNSTSPYTNSTSPSSNGTDDYDFTQSPNYVGAYSILGGYMAGGGNASNPVITEGCLPLTTALQGKEASGYLPSLHPDDVEPYLATNLEYKIIGPGNVEIPADSIPDFHVYVKACKVTPATSSDELPELGEYELLPGATEGKPAGEPFTYTPGPYDYVTPGEGEDWEPGYPSPSETSVPSAYPTGSVSPAYPTGVFPYPTNPESEDGYCISKQTVKYVDPAGNFLYQEMS
jgi:tyrosinase